MFFVCSIFEHLYCLYLIFSYCDIKENSEDTVWYSWYRLLSPSNHFLSLRPIWYLQFPLCVPTIRPLHSKSELYFYSLTYICKYIMILICLDKLLKYLFLICNCNVIWDLHNYYECLFTTYILYRIMIILILP